MSPLFQTMQAYKLIRITAVRATYLTVAYARTTSDMQKKSTDGRSKHIENQRMGTLLCDKLNPRQNPFDIVFFKYQSQRCPNESYGARTPQRAENILTLFYRNYSLRSFCLIDLKNQSIFGFLYL
jgi:hypothetical protein